MLRLTETRSTYNIVVEVEGVIDVHYASLTSQGVQHRVFYRDDYPSRYQPRPNGLNFGEQTGSVVFPLVIAVPVVAHGCDSFSFQSVLIRRESTICDKDNIKHDYNSS